MRIGFFTDTYRPQTNGITYVIDIMRKNLEDMGHEVFIFAPGQTRSGYEDNDDHIIRFPALKGFFYDDYLTSVFFPPQEIRRIREYDLDLVQFFTPSQVGLLGCAVAKKYKLPLVCQYSTDLYEYIGHYPSTLPGIMALMMFVAPFSVTPRGSDFTTLARTLRPQRRLGTWSKDLVRTTCTLLHNHCDAVIALSKKKEDQLRDWGTTSQLLRIPTGVDPLPSSKAGIKAFKIAHGLSDSDEVVQYVGRMGAEKNIDLLIDAFEIVARHRPKAKLLLVGDFEYRKTLEEHAARLGAADKIIFTGTIPREELGNVYGAAKVFVFPSMTDTQGLVLHEAANAGVPLVLIDKDVNELLDQGKTGFFAENTPASLAAAIENVLKLPADEYTAVSNAVKRRARLFSERKQTEKCIKLYESLREQKLAANEANELA